MLGLSFYIIIALLGAGIILFFVEKNIYCKLLSLNYANNLLIVAISIYFAITGDYFYLDIALIFAICSPIATIFISRIIR